MSLGGASSPPKLPRQQPCVMGVLGASCPVLCGTECCPQSRVASGPQRTQPAQDLYWAPSCDPAAPLPQLSRLVPLLRQGWPHGCRVPGTSLACSWGLLSDTHFLCARLSPAWDPLLFPALSGKPPPEQGPGLRQWLWCSSHGGPARWPALPSQSSTRAELPPSSLPATSRRLRQSLSPTTTTFSSPTQGLREAEFSRKCR